MRKVTLEQQFQDEVKRMILEEGDDNPTPSISNTPHWDAMKDYVGEQTPIFVTSFMSIFVKGVVICMIIILFAIFKWVC